MSYKVHKPEWEGTTTRSGRESPGKKHFDSLDRAAEHFLVSESGFPPDQFSDLHIPVVDMDGNLNLNMLSVGKGAVRRLKNIDDKTVAEAQEMIDELAQNNFEQSFGEEKNRTRGHSSNNTIFDRIADWLAS